MTYQEFFDGFKAKYEKKNTRSFKEHVAIQFTITDDDCGGVFYLEMLDGKMYIEPYSYDGYDASFECSAEVLTAIFNNKLKLCDAFKKNQIQVTGDMGKVVRFKMFTENWKDRAVRKPAKKTAKKVAKKPAAKKATAKTAAAKEPAIATKSADKPVAKKAAAKPAAKNPATKKTAAKKAPAKKPAAKPAAPAPTAEVKVAPKEKK